MNTSVYDGSDSGKRQNVVSVLESSKWILSSVCQYLVGQRSRIKMKGYKLTVTATI